MPLNIISRLSLFFDFLKLTNKWTGDSFQRLDHRNIAEGYCRRSIKEYLNFLNIALGSLGESVSGLHAYRKAEQITEESFQRLDSLAYKLENELLKLVESLEEKRNNGDWIDYLRTKESNALYEND